MTGQDGREKATGRRGGAGFSFGWGRVAGMPVSPGAATRDRGDDAMRMVARIVRAGLQGMEKIYLPRVGRGFLFSSKFRKKPEASSDKITIP
ncbi:hypothetical protein [Burkholderia plantarii]|uniref:hypothetical protein n=1 Tax=Burkholderia plantarii TaxID=41899 RepID=UPI0018DDA04D|nr:hypothetical protein [Burkholderia plantarii]MBI0329970.1 hypothetical protein [Burkholderia plantarii]